MRTLTIRKMPQAVIPMINAAIERAYGFLCAKYGWHFTNVDLVFSTTLRRSRYYRNKNGKNDGIPVAQIHVYPKLYTYNKKTIGVTANGLNIGYELNVACALVHELTHHIQYELAMNTGELETTKNEIDFLGQADAQWYQLLKTI